jgi:hypothetical protein
MTTIKLSNAQQTALSTFTARYAAVGVELPTKTVEALVERKLLAFVAAKLEVAVFTKEGGAVASLVITDAGLDAIGITERTAYGVDPTTARLMAGVMVKSYHDLYMAQGGGSGDNVDTTMREVFMTKSREVQTKKGIRAEPALDVEALRTWGVEIGLWNDRWDALNPGMRRMNLANRVRGAIRRGTAIELKGTKLSA